MKISVAIDGPAGAGKSTVAKRIAEKNNYVYINTGAMYRAVTLFALEKSITPQDKILLIELVNKMEMKFVDDRLIVNGEDIHDKLFAPYISENVSYYSKIEEVRKILVDIQKKMAEVDNVVMEGRDIGSVVLKDSKFKFFITASAEVRAKRRYEELLKQGENVSYEDILQKVRDRDYIDINRKDDPLIKCEDAMEIDTSNMDTEEVVDLVSSYIEKGKLI